MSKAVNVSDFYRSGSRTATGTPCDRAFRYSRVAPRGYQPSSSETASGRRPNCFALVVLGAIALCLGCGAGDALGNDGWAMRFDSNELRKDSEKFLPLLEEPERPARWRRQLDHWRAMKEAYLQAEVQQAADDSRRDLESVSYHRQTLLIATDLRIRGNTAPSGALPDMLEVVDNGNSVLVRNDSDRTLSILVWRYAEFEWAGKAAHDWCPMAAERLGEDFRTPVEIAPGEIEVFLLSDHKDCSRIHRSTVSIEVYEGDRLVWASEPMLARREATATQQLEMLEDKLEATTREARSDDQ